MARVPIALSVLAVSAALAVSACGGSSGESQGGSSGAGSSTNGRQGGGPFAALQDKEVQACLKKQGVEVPTMPSGGGQNGQNGQPPSGYGQPPSGYGQQPPQGGEGGPPQGGEGGGPPQGGQGGGFSDELRAALKKCGVTLPEPGRQGDGQQGGGQTTTTPEATNAA